MPKSQAFAAQTPDSGENSYFRSSENSAGSMPCAFFTTDEIAKRQLLAFKAFWAQTIVNPVEGATRTKLAKRHRHVLGLHGKYDNVPLA